jgi:putative Mn2+ efflux pump MntP
MILAGWAAGTGILMYFAGFDHWLAFFLLVLIGMKMIIEGFEEGDETGTCFRTPDYSGGSARKKDRNRRRAYPCRDRSKYSLHPYLCALK